MKSKRLNLRLIFELERMREFNSRLSPSRNSDSRIFLLFVQILVVASIMLFISNVAKALDVSADLTIVGDAVNLEFEGRSDWPYEIQRKGREIHVSLPKIDPKSRSKVLSWKGPLIEKIEIKKDTDERDTLVFTLTRKDIQTFDYLTDQPSRLIVDFFVVEEKPKTVKNKAKAATPLDVTVESKISVAEANIKKEIPLPTRLPKKGERAVASTELIRVDGDSTSGATNKNKSAFEGQGIFDGGDPDFERFDVKDYEINPSAIIASQQNIYVRFPMLTSEDGSLEKILGNTPIYEIKAEESDENKKARLLLTLFTNKRYAVFLRTVDFFRQAFPKSKYDEILRYMEADIYYELFKKDGSLTDFQVAMTKYKALILDYPKSPLAERTQLLVGYSYRQRGDVLGTLSELESYIRKFPHSTQRHQVKLAIADSYGKIHKYDDAEKILLEIEADPQSGDYAAAAAYKRADVYFEKKDYDLALKSYQENRRKYPGSDLRFPSASYNTAEALFWQGDYKKSLDTYREFLQKFPTSGHGGYAMTRIGELIEILGGEQKKVTGAYLESLFRYRGSQGAGIANIRLTCERLKDMKPKEIEAAIKEVREFVTSSDLPRIKDFEVLMLSDGFYGRGEYGRALELLQNFFRDNPTSSNLDIFKTRIVRTVTKNVKTLVDNKNYIDAFRLYGQNASTWLKGSDRIDLKYYIGRAYEGSGVPAESAKIYREALNKRYSIANTKQEAERKVFEKLPSADTLNLRLAASSAQQNNFTETGSYLSDIKNPTELTADEQIERTSLAAKVSKAKGDFAQAESYINELISKWKGQPEKLAPSYLELAQLQFDQKKYGDVAVNLEKVKTLYQDTGLVSLEVHSKSLELKADSLLAQGKKNEAIGAYKELLEAYESVIPLGSIRYKVGKLLFEQGKFSEAEKIWSALAAHPDNRVWDQLAKEQLAHSQWQQDYKKYLNRIPAMSGEKN